MNQNQRRIWFERLFPGGIFHAYAEYTPSLICLVTSVSDESIYARVITTQKIFEFSRVTGVAWAKHPEDGRLYECRIDSIEPLPGHVHHVALGIDRKFRRVRDVQRCKLNDDEIEAFIFMDSHYRSFPFL